MQEFRYSKFLKVFCFIFCPALVVLFGWLLFQYDEHSAVVYFAILLPISLAMIALGVLGIADVIMARFIIAHDRVILRSPFGYRMMMLEEIRGFRQDKNYIRIIPVSESQKKLKISNYLNRNNGILDWLYLHYPDLDIAEGDEEEHQVLQSDEVGFTEERRLERLEQARKIAKVLSWGAWILLAWMLLFPKYFYELGILLCCIFPVIALYVTVSYRGIFSPDEYDNSKMPSIATAFILPGITLALRAIMDFTILEYPTWFWFVMGFITIAFTVMYMLPSFRNSSKPLRFYGTALAMAFLNIFYAFGVLVEANCLLDKSEPSVYETTIAGKHTTSGKSTTYYVDLNGWGTRTEQKEVKVTRQEYDAARPGDAVSVLEYAGYLKVPWIEIIL